MRFIDLARPSAVLFVAFVLTGCPKKDPETTPEPASAAPAAASAAAPVGATDKAGAEAPKKKDDDKGGW